MSGGIIRLFQLRDLARLLPRGGGVLAHDEFSDESVAYPGKRERDQCAPGEDDEHVDSVQAHRGQQLSRDGE